MRKLSLILLFFSSINIYSSEDILVNKSQISRAYSKFQKLAVDQSFTKKYAEEVKKFSCNEKNSLEDIKQKLNAMKRMNQGQTLYNIEVVRNALPYLDDEFLKSENITFAQLTKSQNNIETILIEREQIRKKANLCLFNRELKDQIRSTLNQENKDFLQQLSGVSSCLGIVPTANQGELKELSSNIFDSIFNFFSKKEPLGNEDCEVLKKTYEVWSSFYDEENSDKDNSEEEIPFYNVNPHNSAYFYWVKEKANGNIPPEGLSLLHIDTHTDLDHIHSYNLNSYFDGVALPQVSSLLYELKTKGKPAMMEMVNTLEMSDEKKLRLRSWIQNQNAQKLAGDLETTIRGNVHKIAQPLVGASASGITRDITMVLPPWATRINRSKIVDGQVQKQPLQLVQTITDDMEESEIKFLTSEDQNYLQIPNKVINSSSLYNKDEYKVLAQVDLSVADANTERRVKLADGSSTIITEQRKLAPLSSHLQSKKFILDIDLDGFVSDGISKKHGVEPISFGRTQAHNAKAGEHGGHQNSNETDPRIAVSTMELDLIDQRLNSFFDRLEQAKEDGHTPAVITISDSTTLMRALEGQEQDGAIGGKFTPSCLVFLLNYRVRQRMQQIYGIQINN